MNNLISHYLFTSFNLTTDMSTEIAHRSRLMTIGKRDLFKVSTDHESRVIIVLEGHAKLMDIDTEGNQEVRELFHSGELFDSSTLASKNDAYLQSLSSSTKLAVIGQGAFEELLTRSSNLYSVVDQFRKKRIRKLHRRMNYLTCRDVEQKLLIFLKEMVLNDGKASGEKVVVDNYLTHNDIAEIVNISRQTVTSLLNKFRSQGKIEYSRRELILLDKTISPEMNAA